MVRTGILLGCVATLLALALGCKGGDTVAGLTYTVSGSVTGHGSTNATIWISDSAGHRVGGGAQAQPDGSFNLLYVHPGSWLLNASGGRGAESYYASIPITVPPDVSDVRLQLLPD